MLGCHWGMVDIQKMRGGRLARKGVSDMLRWYSTPQLTILVVQDDWKYP